MKQKKLMLLGGIRYLLPVIEAVHKLGVYVIKVDCSSDIVVNNCPCAWGYEGLAI